jgi:predicted choloylglycine hydrolase
MKLMKLSRMCSFWSVVLCLALLAGLTGCEDNPDLPELTEVSTFEGGTAYRTEDDIYWVLSLSGSWKEMGRQYGGLVADDLNEFYTAITQDMASRGMDSDELLEVAEAWTASLNNNMRELMQGMSETSGLTYNQIQQLNASMVTLPVLVFSQEPPSSCSAIAVWGDYTADGKLIIGRNWDMDRESMQKYMKYLAVVLYNPDSGNSFADVHPLGNIYVETGFNEKGLFIELNNGMESDPNYYADRKNSVAVLAEALNQCSTIDEAVDYIGSIPADASYIIQVADSEKCVSIERPTFGYRVRTAEPDGLLVAYNSFIPPYPVDWQGRVPDPPTFETDPRYENLMSTANSDAYYGKFNVVVMKQLMSLDAAHGGAVHNGTVLQVIAVPADLMLWIRGYNYSDWQQIDLSLLFG